MTNFNPGLLDSEPDDAGLDSGEITIDANGSGSGIDGFAGLSRASRRSRNMWIVVAIVVSALGGIFAMRMLVQATSLAAADVELDERIQSLLTSLTGGDETGDASEPTIAPEVRHEQILKVLGETYAQKQVPLMNLASNPFVILGATTVEPLDVETDIIEPISEEEILAQRRAEREALLHGSVAFIELRSIVLGRIPLANIDGSIVGEGDTIYTDPDKYEFVIIEILQDRVVLRATVETLDLVVDTTIKLRGR